MFSVEISLALLILSVEVYPFLPVACTSTLVKHFLNIIIQYSGSY